MPTDRATDQDWLLAGRYRLGRVLGSGGGGIVRESEDTLLRRRVAIKEVRLPPLASQAERHVFGERVLREARAAARLHHPGLVTVYDVIEADEHPWIVMEYVDGTSLAELIRESGRLSPLRVARIGVSLAYALEAAHRAGVVHRDVKPGNVLVTGDGQVRLTDFGIAVIEGDAALTSTGMLVGSPAYISPERALGARAGAASDVWGLGATLFTAVEGDPPFAGEDPLATLAAVVENRRRPFRYSGALNGVLTQLLDSDPTRRPSLAEARRRLRKIAESIAEETPDGRATPDGQTQTDVPVPDVRVVPGVPVPDVPDVSPATATADESPAVDEGRTGAETPPRTTAPIRRPDEPGRPATTTRLDTDVSAEQADEHVRRAHGSDSGLDVLTGDGPVPPGTRGTRPDGAGGDAGPDRAAPTPTPTPTTGGGGRDAGRSASAAGHRGIWRSRTALLAAVAVALIAAAAITLSLVPTGGSHPSRQSGGPTVTRPATTPGPTRASTQSPSTEPSTKPSTRPSATSSPGQSGTAEGSGAAGASDADLGALVPGTTAPAAAPAGFTSRRDPSGWSAALPANWTITTRGAGRETFTAPSGYPSLLIEAQEKAGPSAIAAWHSLEPGVRSSSPGYRRLSIRAADGGDGTNAAIWEFTSTSGGRTVHVLDLGVVRNGHGYGLLWRVPEDQWQNNLSLMRTVFATFRPGP
jgi:serine/threonine protein kinase